MIKLYLFYHALSLSLCVESDVSFKSNCELNDIDSSHGKKEKHLRTQMITSYNAK